MALYAALLYYEEDGGWARREHLAEQREFLADPAAGDAVRGWQALCPASTATTITVAGGPGGDVVITDGPYAEAKEVLGGFYLLEAADLDQAIRWAVRIPSAWRGKIELRPVLPVNPAAARS